jgi:TPR repeat protein
VRLDALPLLALVACGRSHSSNEKAPAPTSSVITLGAAIGGCDDVALCERECERGSADRCRRLAATYALGQGVEKDEARATSLYAKACDMKDAPACVFAGQMNEYAHGVQKDDTAAARFYERACDQGWAAGCYNFAIMLEHGRGVPTDRPKAGSLYQVACTAGAKGACVKASEILGMSPSD